MRPWPPLVAALPRQAAKYGASMIETQETPALFPETPLVLIDGERRQVLRISSSPFTVGRAPGCDLVLSETFISREHARIVYDGSGFWIEDAHSRHGVLRNGQTVQRERLTVGDELRIGGANGPILLFGVQHAPEDSLRDLLGETKPQSESDLLKLRWFLEAARRLNATGALDGILASLAEIALELTGFERGFVFLCSRGQIQFAAGRTDRGQVLSSDAGFSQSALKRALDSAEPYILTDTLTAEAGVSSESLLVKNIRAVIAMPLRTRSRDAKDGLETLGILYLDSRLKPGVLSEVDHGLLQTIATEAAALVENAQLAVEEEAARRYREELAFAAGIQQQLMAVRLPELPFARIDGLNLPCKEIGGDFFDALGDDHGLAVVLADVSGKGASAAILAATLQGLVYSQLMAGAPLVSIAQSVNAYLCAKNTGKYATMVLVRLSPEGVAEYLNCGHIAPLRLRPHHDSAPCEVDPLEHSNLPVGLIPGASFTSERVQLFPDERLVLVSDGITEAEDAAGEFFGEPRLLAALRSGCTQVEALMASVAAFCGPTPANDDRTVVHIAFRGASA
jgi:sigma-B regulation protein RsbU (phosphoserine phosphatase)